MVCGKQQIMPYLRKENTNRIKMKDFSKATKVGMLIMLVAGIIMALLVVAGKPVPDLFAWVFFAGLVISIVSALFVKKR